MINRIKTISFTSSQVLAIGFALIIAVGAVLLAMPVSAADGKPLPWLDALFTATSATCVTGLAVLDTGARLSLFGQVVLLAMVQLGGIGFMTMTTWFAMMLGKRMTLREQLILKESMNHANTDGIALLIRKVMLYSLAIEGAAALLYTLRWSTEMPLGKALYYGVFHAISIFNNAGFDLFSGFAPYAGDLFFNIVSIVLVILGGIGFLVMSDLIEWPRTRQLSLHSKVVLSASGLLIVIGAGIMFLMEYSNEDTMGNLNDGSKMLAALFQSVSLRSSGTSTIDIAHVREATQLFMIVLMFIGAAPGSTGGGIKITTFAILLGAVVAMVRRKEDVVLFRRRLAQDQVYRAVTVSMMAVLLVSVATMAMSLTERQSFLTILFEVVSAFGTVGFSAGMTQELTVFGKICVMIMMFIGRLGPVTLAYALQRKVAKDPYRYPEGKIMIG